MAAMIHVNDHNGYLPIAGWHFDPVGGVVNPKGLADENERRYIYYTDNGVKRPVPFTVCFRQT